jgi:hypothetical protein
LRKTGNRNVQSRENPVGESPAGYGIFSIAMPERQAGDRNPALRRIIEKTISE